MINFKTGKPILVIIDEDYYPLIFLFKNNNPTLNIKIINKSELVDKLGYQFKEDPLPYLIKEKGLDYNKAKRLLTLIRYLRGAGQNYLSPIIDELKEYLDVDEYGLYELNRYEIYLLELDEDEGIKTLLTNNKLNYNLIHLENLDIKNTIDLKEKEIIYFSNKFAQFSYIFSDIRQKILVDRVDKNSIKVLIKDDGDIFYIQNIARLFDLDTFYNKDNELLSNPLIGNLVNEIYKNKKIELVDSEEEAYKTFNELVSKYQLDKLDDFDFAFANLMEVLSSYKIKDITSDKGITITNRYLIKPNDIVYVTNFEYGCFYKEYADNNVLSDSIINELGLTTSFNKTSLDERKKRNYLRFNNIVILSRVKQHLTDSIYDSQFIETLLNKKKIKSVDKINEINKNGLYTNRTKLLIDSHRYDQYHINSKVNEYRSYDHSFKGVDASRLINPERWSVTDLEKYNDCPFKYFIDKLIPLPYDKHNAYRGTLIHAVLEEIMHEDFDFEKSFVKGKEKYIEEMKKDGEEYTEKEEVWIEIYKHWLKNIVLTLLRSKEWMDLVEHKNDYERKIYFEIGDYKFKGVIDKLIYTKNGEDTFYSIVDYKSGKEIFDPLALAAGKSIQLPLYYYAIISQKDPDTYTDGYTFGGWYIQHTYFSSIKSAFVDDGCLSENRLINNTTFSGLFKNDESYFRSIDNTAFTSGQFETKNTKFIDHKTKSFNEVDDDSMLLKNPIPGVDRFNVNDIVELSKKIAVEIIEKIKANQFDIAPSSKDITKRVDIKNLRCQYCENRDICYMNPIKDSKDFYSYIRKTLQGKEID